MKKIVTRLLLSMLCGAWLAPPGMAQPLAFQDSPFGFHPASIGQIPTLSFSAAQDIGVRWHRPPVYAFWSLAQPDRTRPTYDWSVYDAQYGLVPAGINILANIAVEPGLHPSGYSLAGSYLPVDTAAYQTFVRALVERYDGDGVNDMPGLTVPIRYWQVSNEIGNQLSGFPELQRITYTAIKDACPDCYVLIGGVGGMPDNYPGNFNGVYLPILRALAGRYMDIFDFHWYGNATGDYRKMDEALAVIRAGLQQTGFGSVPIWVTEMGTYSGDPADDRFIWPFQTEAQQAGDLLKRFVHPLAVGIGKVFPAFGLKEGFKQDDGYFDHTGLIYDGQGSNDLGLGIKKLGYYTYKKMTELLEGADWNNIQTVQESGNVYVYKFNRNGAPVYVAWWDYFNDPTYTPGKTMLVTIAGVSGNTALVTEAVPMFSSGAEVTNYTTAFRQQTLPLTNGAVTLALGESPVFVEGPAVSLRVNGSSNVTVTVSNPVTVEYIIRGGQGQELFLALDAPAMGRPWSFLNATGQWVPLPANLNDVIPFATAQADGDYPLYTGTVPAGAYTLCLGYDSVKNGFLNMENIVYDCSEATVR